MVVALTVQVTLMLRVVRAAAARVEAIVAPLVAQQTRAAAGAVAADLAPLKMAPLAGLALW